ncbi:MAG: GvpL/GvpF family gas vesicle protein [Actinomycetia bacterium]|nr:GvpL/GvpF family gas vesicle protein [Actinomycetes bacterium]
MPEGAPPGLYLYCIAADQSRGAALTVSAPALDGSVVRVVSQDGLLVAVHACPAEPYQGSPDDVHSWILAHNKVVTEVWEGAGTVLPMTFDSIVTGGGGRDAESALADWIGEHREILKAMLTELDGKVELGVRIYYNDVPLERSERVAVARGREYFQNQISKRREAADRQLRLDAEANRIVDSLGTLAHSIRLNQPNATAQTPDEADGRELLSVSLLVERQRVPEVGSFLDAVTTEGYRVRFTGPWPPYSFADALRVPDRGDS